MCVDWPALGYAVAGGLIGGLVILGSQRLWQFYLDRLARWPFNVDPIGLSPNPVGTWCEARVVVYNPTSKVTRLLPTLLDADGSPVNGSTVRPAWESGTFGSWIVVAPKQWTEVRLECPLGPRRETPRRLRLKAHTFTLEKGKEQTYDLSYDFSF